MHDALRLVFPQNVHHIAVGLAVVDDNGQVMLFRELQLGDKHLFLLFARALVLPVVVEADLADGDDLRVGKQRFHVRKPVIGQVVCALRVDADCTVDIIVFFTERHGFFEAFIIGCHIDDRNDALLRQHGAEQLVTVDVDLLAVVMCVGIKYHRDFP